MRKDFSSEKKVLCTSPLEDSRLKISVPVDSHKVTCWILSRDEAEEILGVQAARHELDRDRYPEEPDNSDSQYLKRKKHEAENKGKKLHKQDDKLLTLTQNVLFTELAMSLDTTFEKVDEMVSGMIQENYKGC